MLLELLVNISERWRYLVQEGIVLSNISNLYKVEIGSEIYDCNARGKFKSNDISPVSGDIVDIEITDEAKKVGIITNIHDRKNYLKRPKMANLTQIVLVVSMKLPKPDLELLDKQLVYAEFMEIKPIICLNKIDLEDEKKVEEIFKTYKNIGYHIIKTNAKEDLGVDKLKKYLNNNITAFSGNSGVGKSTLINDIFEKDMTEEGVISNRNKRGKNTTTQVKLYKVEKNSYIADTPGFSTFDIKEIPKEDLAKYFIEFRQYIDKCEYADCSHMKEQKCGIKNALVQGKISRQRYENYCKMKQGGRSIYFSLFTLN